MLMKRRSRASRRRPLVKFRPSFAIAAPRSRGRRGRSHLRRTSGRRRRCAKTKRVILGARGDGVGAVLFRAGTSFVFRGVRAWLGARAASPSQRWCWRARTLRARRPGASLRASARSSSWRGYDSGALPSHFCVLVARRRKDMSAVSPALAGVCPSADRCCAKPR